MMETEPQVVEQPERRSKRLRTMTIIVGAVVVIGLAISLGTRFGKDPRLVESPLIDNPAPLFEAEYLEQPGTWSLADHRGHVVVVNFWASWCVACRLEHDDLMATAAAYGDQGVVMLGVTFQDESAESIAFLDEMGRGYDSVVDPGSRIAVDYGVFGIPETFVIDADGIVRAKIAGESTFAALAAQIDPLLAGVSK